MTCIVGFIEKDKVIIGGDSAGVGGLSIHIRRDPKVFKTGPFIMGFTSSFRMGQLLMSSMFKPPHQKKTQSDYDFMVTTFIEAIKDCFDEGGYSQKYKDGDDKGGTFLVGYKGELYMIESDYQVALNHDKFMAVGCGEELAEGAMFALTNSDVTYPNDPKGIMTTALEAAAHFSGGVEAPFNFVEMTKKTSTTEANKIKAKTKKKKSKGK